MSNTVEIPCMEHQLLFMQSNKRYVADVGGFGCGKSFAVGMKLYNLALINQGFDGMLVSRTGTQLTKLLIEVFTVFRSFGLKQYDKDFKRFQREAPGHTFMMYDGNQVVIKWNTNTFSTIWLGTTENNAYEKWAGGNMAFVVIDEIDTMPKADMVWKFANDRVRVKAPLLQTACASTPEGFGFMWDFFENQPTKNPELAGDREIIRGCTLDSPYLDASYVRNQIRTRDPASMMAYIYGHFVNLNGALVYWNFKKDLNRTTRTIKDMPMNAYAHVSIDWNKNINATNISYVENGLTYTVHEINGSSDAKELIIRLKKILNGRRALFYPDGSGYEGIRQLEAAFGPENVKYHAANPHIPHRVAALNQRMCNDKGMPQTFINPETCPVLWMGLLRQVKDAKGYPDKSQGLDHNLDGYGYFHHWNWPVDDGIGTISTYGTPDVHKYNSIRDMMRN